jgi:hypothetical protein
MYQAPAWRLDLTREQEVRLQAVLDAASAFHRELCESHMALNQERRDRMAVIVGVGQQTMFRLEYRPLLGFLWEHMEKVTSRDPGDAHREGDGRVPLASAALESAGETRYVKGVHAGLPMVPDVYNDVFQWLNEEEMELPRTPVAALSQHLAVGETLSEAPNLDGTVRADRTGEDPGFLHFEPPNLGEIQQIERELDAGGRPEFTRLRLL